MKSKFHLKLSRLPVITRSDGDCGINLRFDNGIETVRRMARQLAETKDVTITIEPYESKRSLDANAYAWVLIRELSKHYKVKPIEVYQQQILELGTYTIVPIKDSEVEAWMSMWEDRGSGWLVHNLGQSKIKGYTNLKCYRGSSSFNSKEMSVLIDNLIQECEAADIPVERERIEEARKEWRKESQKSTEK